MKDILSSWIERSNIVKMSVLSKIFGKDNPSQKITRYFLMEIDKLILNYTEMQRGPGWCSSVDWVPACEPKGRLVPPVRAHAWVVGQVPSRRHVRGNRALMFLSFSFSLPSHLSIYSLQMNKFFLKNAKGQDPR